MSGCIEDTSSGESTNDGMRVWQFGLGINPGPRLESIVLRESTDDLSTWARRLGTWHEENGSACPLSESERTAFDQSLEARRLKLAITIALAQCGDMYEKSRVESGLAVANGTQNDTLQRLASAGWSAWREATQKMNESGFDQSILDVELSSTLMARLMELSYNTKSSALFMDAYWEHRRPYLLGDAYVQFMNLRLHSDQIRQFVEAYGFPADPCQIEGQAELVQASRLLEERVTKAVSEYQRQDVLPKHSVLSFDGQFLAYTQPLLHDALAWGWDPLLLHAFIIMSWQEAYFLATRETTLPTQAEALWLLDQRRAEIRLVASEELIVDWQDKIAAVDDWTDEPSWAIGSMGLYNVDWSVWEQVRC